MNKTTVSKQQAGEPYVLEPEHTQLVMLGRELRKIHAVQARLDFVERFKNRPGTTPVNLALIEMLAVWHDAPLRYQISS